jgi:adenylate cyclase
MIADADTARSVIDWLLDTGRFSATTGDLLTGYAERLVAAGVPLDRLNLAVRVLHPLEFTRAYCWTSASRHTDEIARPYGTQDTGFFLDSPVAPIFEGGGAIRRRLDSRAEAADFPILAELAAAGYVDYTARPLRFSSGRTMAITLATRTERGFSDAELATVDATLPALAPLVELAHRGILARTLLDTYVGHRAGERILAGDIVRGRGESLDAAIWFSDLRGFTVWSEQLPRDALLDMLNSHFDTIIGPIQTQGGEVLKFLGDGVLAVFPADKGGMPAACEAALAATRDACRDLARLAQARHDVGAPVARHVIALHAGPVSFGNVGSADRLDFTVIGPAVNLASRLNALGKELARDVVLSAAFAERIATPVHSLGRFALRGIAGEHEAFTPAG